MHVRPLLCESSTVSFDRSNVSVNVRPYADCAGRPTKCGFSHTHTCVRSSTWWVRTRNGHKMGRTHFSLGGTYTKTLTWLLKILIDMPWWDLNTKSFRRFSAIKNTYWHALVRPLHKIFTTIFSYQEYLLTCIGGTLTQNLFGDFQLSIILIDMHWWDLNTKSFRRFSAIKNTYWHALVGP